MNNNISSSSPNTHAFLLCLGAKLWQSFTVWFSAALEGCCEFFLRFLFPKSLGGDWFIKEGMWQYLIPSLYYSLFPRPTSNKDYIFQPLLQLPAVIGPLSRWWD